MKRNEIKEGYYYLIKIAIRSNSYNFFLHGQCIYDAALPPDEMGLEFKIIGKSAPWNGSFMAVALPYTSYFYGYEIIKCLGPDEPNYKQQE